MEPKGKGGLYPALFLFSIFFLSVFQIKSYDLWWHLKAGESIVGAGFKPAPANIFSWTEPDHPWVNFSWLFDVIVYSIHNAAGFNGLILFQAVLVTTVFFFVYKTLSQFSQWHRLPACEDRQDACPTKPILILSLFFIAYFAARFRFSLRPHLLALLIFAIDIYLLNKLSATSSQRPAKAFLPFYLIPMLQIVWANVHGSAIIGVLLPGIYIIGAIIQSPFAKGGRKGDYSLILLLTAIASLFNPYGYHILTDSFAPFFGQGADLFNTLTIDEWQMPDKDIFLGWYGLLFGIGVISFFPHLVKTPRRGVFTDFLLFSTFALLSIKAVRFIDLFAVAAVPVIYRNVVSGQWSVVSEGSQKSKYHPSILYPFLVLSLFWFIGVKDTTFTLGLGVDKEVIPQKAVDFMETNAIRGKIFNSYNFGGYLIYRGYPVFIDGRLCYSPGLIKDFADANLYPPHPDPFDAVRPELVEGVNGSQDRPLPQGARGVGRGWKKIEEKYGPDIVLVEYDKPAIPEVLLSDKKNWALVYWDDLDMLFLKRNDKFSAIIDKNEYRALNPMDMYGRFPVETGRWPVLDAPPGRLYGEGGGEGIFAEAQRRIKDSPESMRAHLLMGNLYMSRGEADKSIVEYETVVNSSLSFGKAEAHNNLGTAYEMVGNVYGAEEGYKSAIRLDRVYPLPQRNLGYLKLGQSDYVEALWHLERFLQLGGSDRNTWAVVSELKGYRDTLILRFFIGGGAMIGILWIVARQFNRRETVPLPL